MTKICRLCKVEKDTSEFYKHTATRDKLRHECKSCEQLRQEKARIDDPGKQYSIRRKAHFKRQYGITIEDYEKAYKEQEGKCKICNEPHDVLHVDHNHTYGFFRGLLCGNCNRMIGMAKENMWILLAGFEYLKGNDV